MAEYKSRHTGEEIDKAVEEVSTKVPLVHDSGGVRALRDVGRQYFHGSSISGIIKITLPMSWTNHFMNIRICGYNYNPNAAAYELLLGGYNFNGVGAAANAWHGLSAILKSKVPLFKNVKFAHDGEKCCILLYPKANLAFHTIVIESVTSSINASFASPNAGWDASLITDESGITNIAETPVNWVVADDGVWYDMLLLNGAEASTGIPQYRKIGNFVQIRGMVIPRTANDIHFFSLPAGFRPGGNGTRYRAMNDSIDATMDRYCAIYADGRMRFATLQGSANFVYYIDTSFIADQ